MPSRISYYHDIKKNIDYISFVFPYNESVIAKIRAELNGATWNTAHKTWQVPGSISTLDKLKEILPQPVIVDQELSVWHANQLQQAKEQVIVYKNLLQEIPNYKFKTIPYDHQKKCFVWAVVKKSGALFLDCGLGKTKIILDLIQFMFNNNAIKKVLIVIPLSVVFTWKDEILKHTSFNDQDFMVLCKYSMEVRKKLLAESNKKIYITNYDALVEMKEDIKAKQFDMIIADESTYIKSIKAKRTKAILELSKSILYRYVLTGTPFGQRLTDVYTQLNLVAPDKFSESFWAFKNRYCQMGGFKGYEITGYQNQDELNKRISQVAQIAKKEDCLDLPPKIYEVRTCELSETQKKNYKEIVSQLYTIINQNVRVEVPMVLAQMTKLSQIASGFIIGQNTTGTNELVKYKDNPKLKVLLETLDELSGKVVIWCRFRQDIKEIYAVLEKGTALTFTGELSEQDREKVLNQYQTQPQIKYLLMTSAGGYGLNLQIAQTLIFYSHDFSLEKRMQTEDRLHRIGNKGCVTIIDLIAEHTIDEYILGCIKEKREFTDNIIRDLNQIINGWRAK